MTKTTMTDSTLQRIALAIAQANPRMGQTDKPFDEKLKAWMAENPTGCPPDSELFCPAETRAANLLREVDIYGTKYCYLRSGDPAGWGKGAVATLFVEPHGGKDDCEVPNYYEDGTEILMRASEILGDLFFEWVNAAVAQVWPDFYGLSR